MADKDKSTKQADLKITDLPPQSGKDADDAKVKGGMMPKRPGITFTGDEVDEQ